MLFFFFMLFRFLEAASGRVAVPKWHCAMLPLYCSYFVSGAGFEPAYKLTNAPGLPNQNPKLPNLRFT